MITESVVCLILHCSRCNTPFRDDVADDYSGVAHFATRDDILKAFNEYGGTRGEYGGWRRFGERVVCSRCQVSHGDDAGFAEDPNARENPRPLPPAEADNVARAQTAYFHADQHVVDLGEAGWTILHPLSCRPNLFECPVNQAAQRDLTEPPATRGRFVCWVDGDGRFTAGEQAVVGAS